MSRQEDRELLAEKPELAEGAASVEQKLEAWALMDANLGAWGIDLRHFPGKRWESLRWAVWRARGELAKAAGELRDRGLL